MGITRHTTWTCCDFAARGVRMWQDAFPCRLRRIFVLGLGAASEALLSVLLQFLSAKVRRRVAFVGRPTDAAMVDELGAHCLPPALGGTFGLQNQQQQQQQQQQQRGRAEEDDEARTRSGDGSGRGGRGDSGDGGGSGGTGSSSGKSLADEKSTGSASKDYDGQAKSGTETTPTPLSPPSSSWFWSSSSSSPSPEAEDAAAKAEEFVMGLTDEWWEAAVSAHLSKDAPLLPPLEPAAAGS